MIILKGHLSLTEKNYKNIFKLLILVWCINLSLKSPTYIFCYNLNIMLVYYIYCGFVACVCLMVISGLKNNDISNRSLVIQFFVSIILYLYCNFYFLYF